jgi:ribosomal protein S18 acetylase RimI-like enzyme
VTRDGLPADELTVRTARPEDWERVVAVMLDWWAGRDLRDLLPRILFDHFGSTSLIVERENALVAFLVGFVCPTHADEAYIHFIGVDPARRRIGLASDLYRRFYRIAEAEGRSVVRAVTSYVNKGSIAFHTRLGFEIMPGNAEIDGVPVQIEPGWTEEGVVHFELRLRGEPDE